VRPRLALGDVAPAAPDDDDEFGLPVDVAARVRDRVVRPGDARDVLGEDHRHIVLEPDLVDVVAIVEPDREDLARPRRRRPETFRLEGLAAERGTGRPLAE